MNNIGFKKIENVDSEEFIEAWKIYDKSFSADEKRDFELHKECMKKKEFSFNAVFCDEKICGFIALWDFGDFMFIEHFAIKEELRNKGIGKIVIEKIKEENENINKGKNRNAIILEAPKPETDIAARRIAFYERNSFVKNEFNYIQPSYGEGKEPVPMIIMSYPDKISSEKLEDIKKEIYSSVYGIKD